MEPRNEKKKHPHFGFLFSRLNKRSQQYVLQRLMKYLVKKHWFQRAYFFLPSPLRKATTVIVEMKNRAFSCSTWQWSHTCVT